MSGETEAPARRPDWFRTCWYWEMSGEVGRMLRNLPERFPRGR